MKALDSLRMTIRCLTLHDAHGSGELTRHLVLAISKETPWSIMTRIGGDYGPCLVYFITISNCYGKVNEWQYVNANRSRLVFGRDVRPE